MSDTALPLILRHRPAAFAEMHGHKEALRSLERRLAEPTRPHAYMLTGPTGVGKTTLARLIAKHLSCHVAEYDAASNSGVEAMRAVLESTDTTPFDAPARMVILDECQMLSRAAWNATLKTLEEPPGHLYLAICTTEYSKVPATVVSRCFHLKLDRLSDAEIEDYVIEIIGKEGWGNTVQPEVLGLVINGAEGSPRRALTLLQAVYDAPDEAAAQRILTAQETAEPMKALLRTLLRGPRKWDAVQPLLAKLTDEDFSETAMIGACRYVIGAVNRAEGESQAQRAWEILAAFCYPTTTHDPKSAFYHAIGRLLWSEI
jgi:DNA polymerase-3 subunit gamma/tau